MKILALTDIHGAYDKASAIIAYTAPDVVIVGGDLTTIGTIAEAHSALVRFRSLAPALLCVAGNMDLPEHDDLFLREGVSLNGRGVVINDIGFCGVSAAPVSPLKTPYEISEEEITRRLGNGCNQIQHCARKIIVPHAPPYGTRVDIIHSGIHVGSTAVREFIEKESPTAVVCGHIHEARGKDVLGTTEIINCGQASKGYYGVIVISENITLESCHLPC